MAACLLAGLCLLGLPHGASAEALGLAQWCGNSSLATGQPHSTAAICQTDTRGSCAVRASFASMGCDVGKHGRKSAANEQQSMH